MGAEVTAVAREAVVKAVVETAAAARGAAATEVATAEAARAAAVTGEAEMEVAGREAVAMVGGAMAVARVVEESVVVEKAAAG